MSKDKPTTIWCKRSTHRWFTNRADTRPHDAFLVRLLTLWDSVPPAEREALLKQKGKTDDSRTDY